jgi:hypothetical protein
VKEAVMSQARAEQREQRQSVLTTLARYGLSILNIARHFLKAQQGEEVQRLREELLKAPKPIPRFTAWLAERNLWEARSWRYRKRIAADMDLKGLQFPKIGNMGSPYLAYRELLLQKYPEKRDESRLDAMIALRMRVAGYTAPEVANEMYRKARPLRTENRDWKDYARRTAWYAFGAAGDIDIAAFKPTPEKIQSFHQEAERLEAERLGETAQVQEAPRLRMR